MRVWLTGATGFVGSDVARVFAERDGARLFCPVHRRRPPGLDSMLARLRAEIDTGRPHPLEAIAA